MSISFKLVRPARAVVSAMDPHSYDWSSKRGKDKSHYLYVML